jgi:hypothetical protein
VIGAAARIDERTESVIIFFLACPVEEFAGFAFPVAGVLGSYH